MRRVVVAGGRGYVGTAVCEAFLADGAVVVSIDLKSATHGHLPSSERLLQRNCDLSDGDSVRTAMSAVAAQIGGVDVVVCAAGSMSPDDGRGLDASEPHWPSTFVGNVTTLMNVVESALPLLRRAQQPSIVVVSSLVALLGSAAAEFAYTAAKGAVLSLSRELAVVLAREGIRVNTVAPGPLDGGLFAADKGPSEALRLARIPMGRRGTASEVAAAVLFLASPGASYITGCTLMVDGGASAAFLPSGA